jgi:hypothetical protein
MDSSIKPSPMIGEILPGFTFLVLFLFCYFRAHPCQFEWILSMGGGVALATSGLVLIISWIIGDFFDACRDICEDRWDHLSEKFARRSKLIKWLFGENSLRWSFFFDGDHDKVDQLEEYWFSYYKLDCNFVIGIILFLLSELLFWKFEPAFMKLFPWYINLIILPFVVGIFAWDARILRLGIKENLETLDKEKKKTK